jgi:hypothetical protein
VKNFPAGWLWRVPVASLARYFWHVVDLVSGQGKASHFRREGNSPFLLVWYTLSAHAALVRALPRLLTKRHAIRRRAKIDKKAFSTLLERHSITTRQVAAL